MSAATQTSMNATELKFILFGNQYRGKKWRNVFHMCGVLKDEIGAEIFEASNNLAWLMMSGRLNPCYLFALREGTAQQVCEAIIALVGITGEYNMIESVKKIVKPVKV